MTYSDEQLNRWSMAASDAFNVALDGGNPIPCLAGLMDAPGAVWRVVALEWVATTAAILKMRAEAEGQQITAFQGGTIPEGALPSRAAAHRCFIAMLNGDEGDAATHFTLAWNESVADGADMVGTLLRLCSDAVRPGGTDVRYATAAPVDVPADASGLEG